MATLLTYREAAARVGRSRRTLWRWRKHGMPMGWDTRDGQRVRVVEETVLLAWWRDRLMADPIRQQRRRAAISHETAASQTGHGVSDQNDLRLVR